MTIIFQILPNCQLCDCFFNTISTSKPEQHEEVYGAVPMKKSATATSDNLRIVRNHFDTNYDPLIASLSVEQPNQFLSFLP
ncbi:hypothetical protein ABG808_03455 [Streptococcus iniae]